MLQSMFLGVKRWPYTSSHTMSCKVMRNNSSSSMRACTDITEGDANARQRQTAPTAAAMAMDPSASGSFNSVTKHCILMHHASLQSGPIAHWPHSTWWWHSPASPSHGGWEFSGVSLYRNLCLTCRASEVPCEVREGLKERGL